MKNAVNMHERLTIFYAFAKINLSQKYMVSMKSNNIFLKANPNPS